MYGLGVDVYKCVRAHKTKWYVIFVFIITTNKPKHKWISRRRIGFNVSSVSLCFSSTLPVCYSLFLSSLVKKIGSFAASWKFTAWLSSAVSNKFTFTSLDFSVEIFRSLLISKQKFLFKLGKWRRVNYNVIEKLRLMQWCIM